MRRERWSIPRDTHELIGALRELGIFAGASESTLATLARATGERDYPAGIDVIREGRIPSRFYIVRSGVLDVFTTGETGSDERKVNSLQEGDYFGEVGIIEGMPSTATVRTATPCKLLSVRAAEFLSALAASPTTVQPLLERIRGNLARSHPSYQTALSSLAEASAAEEILTDVARLADELGPVLKPPRYDELLRAITSTALNLFHAAACSLALVTDDGDELVFVAASGKGVDDLLGRRLPIDQGIAGAVARSGEPLLIPDLAADERFARSFAAGTGYRPTSIVARPLESGGRILGVMEVLDPTDFDDDKDMTILALFARLAALAIENASLFSDFGRTLFRAASAAMEGRPLEETLGVVAHTIDPETRARAVERLRGLLDV